MLERTDARMWREPVAGLVYIFCDEQRFDNPTECRFVTGHIAVPQDGWSRLDERSRQLLLPVNKSRTERILNLLNSLDGVAVITESVVPRRHIPKGEVDRTNDISAMSRPDHIWSVTMALGIVTTLNLLEHNRLKVKTIDVYYDSKSLTASHRQALVQVVTVQIRKSLRELSQSKTRIRRFYEIPKVENDSEPTKFQCGIKMADQLLEKTPDMIALQTTRVWHKDHSEQVIKHLEEKFR